MRRNRTFFFVSYEGLRLRQPFTFQSAVPSLVTRESAPPIFRPILRAFPIPNGPDLGGGISAWSSYSSRPSAHDGLSVRVDHALTTSMLFFARFSDTPSSTAFGLSQANSVRLSDRSATAGLNASLSRSTSNEFRLNDSPGILVDWCHKIRKLAFHVIPSTRRSKEQNWECAG